MCAFGISKWKRMERLQVPPSREVDILLCSHITEVATMQLGIDKLVRIALTEHKFDIGTETEVRMKLVERTSRETC